MARELPTAEQVARVWVLAAKEVGDLPRLTEASRGRSPKALLDLVTRARWLAYAALDTVFPRAGYRCLARFVFYRGTPNNCVAGMLSARKCQWWSEAAVVRVVAGI